MDTNKQIWDFLKSKGLTDYACAGVEGNLYAESGNRTNNLENYYEKKLGMDDVTYTAKVNSGEYTNFVHDSVGYGLAQWTYWSRKQGLLDYCHKQGTSIDNLQMQLEYLWIEMSSKNSLLVALNSAKSVYEASTIFMCIFENPKDQSEKAKKARAEIAQRFYDQYAGGTLMKYIEVLNGVNAYSNKEQGDCTFIIDGRVSNFKVKEFACHDGTDEILIDGDLVRKLQICRDKFGVTTINSAYRTPEYNKEVGGSPKSQHLLGKASDTVCKGATPLELAMYAEVLGMGGIGLYTTFTHIDTRDGKSRWCSTSGTEIGVSTFLKTIKEGDRNQYVGICQKYLKITQDNIFDSQTAKAVRDFQERNGLVVDEIVGVQTWTKLLTQ